MLKQDDSSSPEETSEPSRNRAQIAFIALPKLVAQRGFLDEDHEQMNHSPHQQSISDKQERAKEDGLPDYYRKNSKIHRISNPFVRALFGEGVWRIRRRRRVSSHESVSSRST